MFKLCPVYAKVRIVEYPVICRTNKLLWFFFVANSDCNETGCKSYGQIISLGHALLINHYFIKGVEKGVYVLNR